MSEKDQRHTRQRAAIRDAFEQAGRPLSPKQVLNAALVKVAGFGDCHRLP
jgi:Fe2+ or Zn2+ uptake regulation protein